MDWLEIEGEFADLLASEGRQGVIFAVPVANVELVPEQHNYLHGKLASLGRPVTAIAAISLGIAYVPSEINPLPT